MKSRNLKLFEKYSSNLDIVIDAGRLPRFCIRKSYVCPLCKAVFSIGDLNRESDNMLTIEHIPPKSVTSLGIVLACKQCNNSHGSKFDSELSKKVESGSFLQLTEGSTIVANFKLDNGMDSRGHLQISNDSTIEVFMDGKRTNPGYATNFINFVTGKDNDSKINMTIVSHNKKLAKLSLLRAAYLFAFMKLGYAFVFTQEAERIRKMINKDTKLSELDFVTSNKVPDELLGMSIIVDPQFAKGYLVGFKLKQGKYEENIGVMLPAPHRKSNEFFEYFDGLSERPKDDFNLKIIDLPEVDYILDKRFAFAAVDNWR